MYEPSLKRTQTRQIEQVVWYPWLNFQGRLDMAAWRFLPTTPPTLPLEILANKNVLQDLCFIAYLKREFHIGETPWRIEKMLRARGSRANWAKQWAVYLFNWDREQKGGWEDVQRKRYAIPLQTRVPNVSPEVAVCTVQSVLMTRFPVLCLLDQFNDTRHRPCHQSSPPRGCCWMQKRPAQSR